MARLTKEEESLLKWLSMEDSSAYGECRSKALNGLVHLGLAVVGPPDDRGDDYRRVSLTQHGWRELTSL